jgi:hypothetical protein
MKADRELTPQEARSILWHKWQGFASLQASLPGGISIHSLPPKVTLFQDGPLGRRVHVDA